MLYIRYKFINFSEFYLFPFYLFVCLSSFQRARIFRNQKSSISCFREKASGINWDTIDELEFNSLYFFASRGTLAFSKFVSFRFKKTLTLFMFFSSLDQGFSSIFFGPEVALNCAGFIGLLIENLELSVISVLVIVFLI